MQPENPYVRQARAYLALQEAKAAVVRAEKELKDAEQRRPRQITNLSVIVDGHVVTSHRDFKGNGGWEYTISRMAD